MKREKEKISGCVSYFTFFAFLLTSAFVALASMGNFATTTVQ